MSVASACLHADEHYPLTAIFYLAVGHLLVFRHRPRPAATQSPGHL